MVCEYGIEYEERKHGQLFTLNGAKEILAMLLAECDKRGLVDIKTNCEVKAVNAIESRASKLQLHWATLKSNLW